MLCHIHIAHMRLTSGLGTRDLLLLKHLVQSHLSEHRWRL